MFNKWKILIDVTLTLTQLYKNGYNVNNYKPILFSCSLDWIDHRMSGSTYFDFNIKVAMNTLNKSKATNVGWIMKWWFRSTGNDDHNSNIDFALDDCGKRATLWISMRESKPNAFYWGSSEARPPLYVMSFFLLLKVTWIGKSFRDFRVKFEFPAIASAYDTLKF